MASFMLEHLDFLRKSEDYRRHLIKTLNDAHAYGGSKTGDWGWKVGSDFFKSVESFKYVTPKIKEKIKYYFIDLFALLFWGIFITVLIRYRINKNLVL